MSLKVLLFWIFSALVFCEGPCVFVFWRSLFQSLILKNLTLFFVLKIFCGCVLRSVCVFEILVPKCVKYHGEESLCFRKYYFSCFEEFPLIVFQIALCVCV